MEPKKPLKQMKLKNREPAEPKPEPKPIPPIPQVSPDRINAARSKVGAVLERYGKLVVNKVLKRFKSDKVKKDELKIVSDLIQAAGELDQVNVGEGTMIAAGSAYHMIMILRDRINELEYGLAVLNKELKAIKEGINAKKEINTES